MAAAQKAAAYWRKAADGDPRDAQANKNLRAALKIQATTATNWSWTLSTVAGVPERNPAKAVELAQQAIELEPDTANHWNNLGVAQYRAGSWQAAVDALTKADAMIAGGDRAHRMFLAMAYWQLGDKEKARTFYAQGAAWMAEHRQDNEAQHGFRAEAEQLLGITEEDRKRLVEQHLARDAGKTAETPKEKLNKEGTTVTNQP